ncbi:MAG: hypothetical protein ACK5XP_08390, partial [Sphingobacteriia bacterium]
MCLLCVGCNRELETESRGEDFFPLGQGTARTYLIIDTSFTAQPSTTNSYGLTLVLDPHYRREVQGGVEADQTGRSLQRLELYRSPNAVKIDTTYTFQELWTLFRGENFAERTEGNIRYQVLRFPIQRGGDWDGNAFNTRQGGPDQQDYVYLSTDTTITLHGTTYTGCLWVQQRKASNVLFDVDTYEVYAPNVGLIYRYDKN